MGIRFAFRYESEIITLARAMRVSYVWSIAIHDGIKRERLDGVLSAMINDNSCIYGWRERGGWYTFCIYSAAAGGRVPFYLFREICSARSPSVVRCRRASLSAKLVELNWKSSDIFPGFVLKGKYWDTPRTERASPRCAARNKSSRDWIYFLSNLSGRLDA